MKLLLKHREDFGDGNWYSIVRAEHEGKEGLVPDGLGAHWYSSERIGDACVEGTGEEMRAIALAIQERGDAAFKRCAAHRTESGYEFSSPRNTVDVGPTIPLKDCDELAELILRTVPETTTKEFEVTSESQGKVYVNVRIIPEGQREQPAKATVLGVFSSKERAEAQMWRHCKKTNCHLSGVEIFEITLDEEVE